jgi:uncharacterized protein YndB with AHSA1/START domain
MDTYPAYTWLDGPMFSYHSQRTKLALWQLAREAPMATLSIARTIHAPTALVFRTVADPTHFARAISGVTKIEFLSSAKCGLGTRFRQTRVLNGKEMTLDFDVTDYAENQRVRIVN